MVSGRLPFESSGIHALMVRQATEAPASVVHVAPGLPPALSAAIDQCLARDPDARFADGEALAAALAPAADARPALPPSLRAWLAARNPLLVPYMAWSGLFGTLGLVNLAVWLAGQRPDGPADIVLLAGLSSLPLVPIVGFHLNQAHRQFRLGHTLADLRAALDLSKRERAEVEAATRTEDSRGHRMLRTATLASASWLAVTFGLLLAGVLHENRGDAPWIFAPILSTMALGALSNALDVQFVPTRLREWWQTGLRDRLWNGKVGAWFAKRLGAPERSRAATAAAYRATEVALGAAAGDLFASLPASYREQLEELPRLIASFEARAAEARADMDVVSAMGASGTDAEVLAPPRAERRGAGEHPPGPAAAACRGGRPRPPHDAHGRRAPRWRRRPPTRRRTARGGRRHRATKAGIRADTHAHLTRHADRRTFSW
jgi:serine/threonine-protein kinase